MGNGQQKMLVDKGDGKGFKIQVPQVVLDDLRARLMRVRWPDEIPGAGWDYGTNLQYMKELVSYWLTQFDWRAQERALNEFNHFRTAVDGQGIHFILERLGKIPLYLVYLMLQPMMQVPIPVIL